MINNRYELLNDEVITVDEIRQILESYRIGKKPLAKLLGWGETTIIRYMEGDIPTSEYSNKLKTLLENPEFYYDLLNKRKDCLTNVAYKKSKKAVLSKIMATKIYAAAYYIINKSDADMCPGYIQYLLYYIQAFSLALYDREMFQEDYGINTQNMPYLKLYQCLKRCGVHTMELSDGLLDDRDRDLIEAVLDAFSWYGPKALLSFVNLERTGLKISRDRYNNKIISKESIKNYFKDVCERLEIKTIDDIKKYPDRTICEIRGCNAE